MTRKRKDHLGLQPILPKPEKAALLNKTDCAPFYLINLPHIQQIVKQNDLQINHSPISDQFGKCIKTCKTSKNFCDKCKCINCDNTEMHSNCKSTIGCTKKLFISGITHPECIVSENSQCTENTKDENNFLDKFYYNDKGSDTINSNINNISSLKKTSSQSEYTNELDNCSIIYNFNQEERENVHAYKSSSLIPEKQLKLSTYKNESTILDAFVKIAPCLPETLNKSRNFFTIKRNGKNKLVLNNKVKKILKFVPPNYCNNDRCCPNILEMFESNIAKDNYCQKCEKVDICIVGKNNFFTQNLPNLSEQRIFNSNNFNNLETYSVCNDDDEGNLSRTFKTNDIIKEKVVPNQKEFHINVNDFIDGLESRKKTEEIFYIKDTRDKSIQFNKYCNKNENTTKMNQIENREIFSSFNIDLQSKTVAILKKYRKIAPRTKQINNSNDLEHYQNKIKKTENNTLDPDINYISEQKEYFKTREKIKLNEFNNFEKLKSFDSCICNKDNNTICGHRKYQKQVISKNHNVNTIHQVCNERNNDRFEDNDEESSKVHVKNDLLVIDITDKNSLQKLTFSELIKLSEKFGDRVFHLLSLDEITRKATVELIEHNISNNTENIKINYDFIIDNSCEKADVFEKNLFPYTYESNQIDSFSRNSYIKIIPEISTLKLKNINKEDKKIINFHLSSNKYTKTEYEKKTGSEFAIAKNKIKFLKFLDLYHIDEKIINKVNLNLLQDKGMINFKNPLIPLHRVSKLIKYFKKKESLLSFDKNEDHLYSLGLTLECATYDNDILVKQSDASVENSIGGEISSDFPQKRKRV